MRFILAICLGLVIACAHAQGRNDGKDSLNTVKDDSLIVQSQDTILLKSYATRYDPRKALLYAAVVPGLGQIYNKKYWKLPLVYGGFVFFAYYIDIYQQGYTKYKSQLFSLLNGQPVPPYYPEDQLRTVVDRYRRERDYMIILMGGMYLLQIIDAHVDAHLKEFDLNPNLHVSVQPMSEYNYATGRQNGFSILVRF
jgi:hypothetical protein